MAFVYCCGSRDCTLALLSFWGNPQSKVGYPLNIKNLEYGLPIHEVLLSALAEAPSLPPICKTI